MSTTRIITVKCAVCGLESEQKVLTSTNTFGAPDLDYRPSEMKRSTMNHWIQECPKCGYVYSSLDENIGIDKDWLKNSNYKTCSGLNFKSNLASLFYKYYLINLKSNNYENAFYSILYAAWACDDIKDTENAKHCRILAINEIENLISKDNNNEDLKVLKADLLRRSSMFDKLIEEYNNEKFSEKLFLQIISFQIKKAKQNDTNCYTFSDVTEKE